MARVVILLRGGAGVFARGLGPPRRGSARGASLGEWSVSHLVLALALSLVLVACDEDDGPDGDSVAIDVTDEEKINEVVGGFDDDLDEDDEFGSALALLGDLDDEDSDDIAVGAPGDDRDGNDAGAVWILFLDDDRDDPVRDELRIPRNDDGFDGDLDSDDEFGSALTTLGNVLFDADPGDVETTLVVGAPGDDDGGDDTGAVWLLALDDEGDVLDERKISFTGTGGFLDLRDGDEFGAAVANVGGLSVIDGADGLAVGSPRARVRNSRRGLVWIISLDTDGDILLTRQIPAVGSDFETELSEGDRFGSAIASLGDVDDDGVNDLAVGAPGDEEGAVWILFMNGDGTVREWQKIAEDEGNFFDSLEDDHRFGAALAATGDLDDDGVPDLAVGAPGDIEDEDLRGSFWVVFLDDDGTVLAESEVTRSESGFDVPLRDGDGFGSALADLGDFNSDASGELDIAVGAPGDELPADSGDEDKGAVWLISIDVDSRNQGGGNLLSTSDDRSRNDSLLGGVLGDKTLNSPIGSDGLGSAVRDTELTGLIRDGRAGGLLRDSDLGGAISGSGFTGLLRDGDLNSPIRDRGLASPLR